MLASKEDFQKLLKDCEMQERSLEVQTLINQVVKKEVSLQLSKFPKEVKK
jgi:hypothetical protein